MNRQRKHELNANATTTKRETLEISPPCLAKREAKSHQYCDDGGSASGVVLRLESCQNVCTKIVYSLLNSAMYVANITIGACCLNMQHQIRKFAKLLLRSRLHEVKLKIKLMQQKHVTTVVLYWQYCAAPVVLSCKTKVC